MKTTLAADNFDNGRTPAELAESFGNSYAAVVADDGSIIIGTARVLSDGVYLTFFGCLKRLGSEK